MFNYHWLLELILSGEMLFAPNLGVTFYSIAHFPSPDLWQNTGKLWVVMVASLVPTLLLVPTIFYRISLHGLIADSFSVRYREKPDMAWGGFVGGTIKYCLFYIKNEYQSHELHRSSFSFIFSSSEVA